MNGYTYIGRKMNCSRVVATAERSAGNETIGDKWTETSTFPAEATLQEVMDWAGKISNSGRLTITPDLATELAEGKETF